VFVSESGSQSSDQRLEDSLRLSLVTGVGPRIRQVLLERFGDPSAALDASPNALQGLPGVGAKLCRNIVAARDEIDVAPILQLCADKGVALLTDIDDSLPPLLKEIHDPPGVLYCRGAWTPRDALAVAIVGTRHPTAYGRRQAECLAAGLARAGLTIVSGLARGIDGVAHRGALQAGGRTIAVLGSGVLQIYPPEHKKLADEVIAHGALVSETHPLSPPLSGSFPQRNRIITGLSLGVLVVEAAERSGALISARHAMEQGREVFAMPGPIDSRMSRGCHQLIRDGAKLVQNIDDILEELGPLAAPAERADGGEVKHVGELALNEQERQVLDAVDNEPTSTVHRVLATISALEMRSLIRRLSGNFVTRR